MSIRCISFSEAGLFLPFPQGRRWVLVSHIVRLEGAGNYTYCHFTDEPPLLAALSLKVLAGRLPGGALVRSHRKHLLNPLYIEAVSPANLKVVLTTGERLPVARRRIRAFRQECRVSASA